MNNVTVLELHRFVLVYLLLLIVLFIMKKCQINQTKLLMIASFRMTVQLVLAGLILTHIFTEPHPIFTILYLVLMIGFAIYMTLSKNQMLNQQFKIIVGISLALTGVLIMIFFITIVVQENIFNPQYTIPIGGMIIGNAMTGLSLGLKTFNENIRSQRSKIDTLIHMGVTPKRALLPFVNQAIETAIMPTLFSMLTMGIISLPGMMTGQILSGTLPMTAILYQIAINIAISTVACASVFFSLHFGYKTLYNNRNQLTI